MDRPSDQGRPEQEARRQSVNTPTHSSDKFAPPRLNRVNPAIFIPISTFPFSSSKEVPLTREQELEHIISNLTLQHDWVTQNMLIVAKERVKELRRVAGAELDALGTGEKSPRDAERENARQTEIDIVVKKMTAPVALDANGADYEVTPSHPIYAKLYYKSSDSVPPTLNQKRTTDVVLEELRHNIDRLIDYSLEELDVYENHAKQRIAHYRSLLKAEKQPPEHPGPDKNKTSTPMKPVKQLARKRSVTFANTESSPVTSPTDRAAAGPSKGILRHGHIQSPVDREKLKSMDKLVLNMEIHDTYLSNRWK